MCSNNYSSNPELDTAHKTALSCRKCGLCVTRQNVVFGSGNPHADIMLVGEAPGADEDTQGKPFVGRAGKLLDKVLAEAGISRDDIYIANILKCRPPNNRDPLPDEIEACTPHLGAQICAIKPNVIVTLGAYASRFCTAQSASTPMGKMLNQIYPMYITSGEMRHACSVAPVYHPAACIYDRNKQPILVNDMRRIAEKYVTK